MNNDKKSWVPVWSDRYVSGNEEIDKFHKLILHKTFKLNALYADTKKYITEIQKLASSLEKLLIEHMDLEICYFKKYNVENYEEHEKSHNKFKNEFKMHLRYNINPIIKAILVSELVREYMRNHFFIYDIKDIPKLNEKIKQANER